MKVRGMIEFDSAEQTLQPYNPTTLLSLSVRLATHESCLYTRLTLPVRPVSGAHIPPPAASI